MGSHNPVASPMTLNIPGFIALTRRKSGQIGAIGQGRNPQRRAAARQEGVLRHHGLLLDVQIGESAAVRPMPTTSSTAADSPI